MSRAPIFVRAESGRLVAGNPWAAEQIDKLPAGDYFAVLDKLADDGRNERHHLHGLWWKGLEHLEDRTDHIRFNRQHKAHRNLKIDTGYFVPNLKTGLPEPMSTAISAMSDEAFMALIEDARAYCVRVLNVDPWQELQDEYRERFRR